MESIKSNSRRWMVIALIFGSGLALVLVLSLRSSARSSSATAKAPGIMSSSATEISKPVLNSSNSADPQTALHPSLQGTAVNGEIRLDSRGHMILHRDVRRLFDYYLSLRGRMSDEEIRNQLKEHLKASLGTAPLDEALALFDRYVELLGAEARLAEPYAESGHSTAESLEALMEERRKLRRDLLPAEASEAFFQDQERYESYQLEKLKISTNQTLSAQEKAQALIEAESLLSPEQRLIRKKTFAYLDIKQLAQTFNSSRPIDSQSAEMIRQRFGDEAVDRMQKVQEEKQSWDSKRQAYLAERLRIFQQSDVTPDEKARQWEAYGREHLSQSELRRMQALDSDAEERPSSKQASLTP